ncbi:MAG: hypothetical protein DI592_04770, partial [Stenotrophomonas maltophilia]
EAECAVRTSLSFKPSLHSDTHQKIASAIRHQRGARVVATSETFGALDPEREKERIAEERIVHLMETDPEKAEAVIRARELLRGMHMWGMAADEVVHLGGDVEPRPGAVVLEPHVGARGHAEVRPVHHQRRRADLPALALAPGRQRAVQRGRMDHAEAGRTGKAGRHPVRLLYPAAGQGS